MNDNLKSVVIDDMAGVDAIARHQGQVVFIPLGAPQDCVDLKIEKTHKSYLRASIERIIKPGCSRVTPKCDYYGICGGCRWMHLSEDEQNKQKQAIVARALRHIEIDDRLFFSSEKRIAYRRRARLTWRKKKGDTLAFGFKEYQSHSIVNIEHCPLLVAPLNDAIKYVRRWIDDSYLMGEGSVSFLANEEGDVHISLFNKTSETKKGHLEKISQRFIRGIKIVDKKQSLLLGSDLLTLTQSPFLMASAEVFTQAHCDQDTLLRKEITNAVDAFQPKTIIELFSGIGTLSVALDRTDRTLYAIEMAGKSVECFHINAENFTGSVHAEIGDAQVKLQSLKHVQPDVIVLDPPREGAKMLMPHIARKNPRAIVYLSCDPMTLARDLKVLLQYDYHCSKLRIFDLMPQTHHVETLVVLERR